MAMAWSEVLFAHWPIPPESLAGRIPPGLELETFDGSAWIGVVPFMMRGVRARCAPPLPGLSVFPELNVRTYVSARGKPGVWFFSLDAASRICVRAARATFRLPYFDAEMRARRDGEWIEYASLRTHRGARPARFAGRYRPIGERLDAAPESLERWLTERYCLYAVDRAGRVLRGEIDHAPWPLRRAEAEISINAMLEQIGLAPPSSPPRLLYSDGVDVRAWWVRRV